MPDALSDLGPRQLRVGARVYTADGRDRGLAALLTSANWLLQRLPGMVVEHQRAEVIQTLATAPTIVVEITPAVGVRIKSGNRLLLDIPAVPAHLAARGSLNRRTWTVTPEVPPRTGLGTRGGAAPTGRKSKSVACQQLTHEGEKSLARPDGSARNRHPHAVHGK